MTTPIWIDTDVAIGVGNAQTGYADVDDAFAILQLIKAGAPLAGGMSTVFGNTDIKTATRLAESLSSKFAGGSLQVFEGAGQAIELTQVQPNAAVEALAHYLRTGKARIMAIGPATNIGLLVLLYPELLGQVEEVVLVAGRRSLDHAFKVGPLHDPPFPDLNFDLDPLAFQLMIQAGLNVSLLPFEISHKVWITEADLDTLAQGGEAAQYLALHSRNWLSQWHAYGVKGFNPFDVLASGYMLRPEWFESERLPVQQQFAPDDTRPHTSAYKPYLILQNSISSLHTCTYVHTAHPEFKAWVWEQLMT